MVKKIAVVGAGIFGTTVSWVLAKAGHNVDLFEKNEEIFMQASFINQYRLHRGYHYPRSKETALSSLAGEKSFIAEYGNALFDKGIKRYYAISSKDSFIGANQYVEFLDNMNLEYDRENIDKIIKHGSTQLTVRVKEHSFNPYRLREIVSSKMDKYGVNVHLRTPIANVHKELSAYDQVIVATYANINTLLEHIPEKQQEYQFELCEKPILKLPSQYQGIGVVIMDGPFMCIDPIMISGERYHVMGNVVHAIHHTNVGKRPVVPHEFRNLLNKGVISNPAITNIEKFYYTAQRFFKDIENAEYVGSMYTTRTVLPNRDYDDARPSMVEQVDDKTIVVFSGKIGTCVDE